MRGVALAAAVVCCGPAMATAYAISNEPVHCHTGPGHEFPLARTYDALADVRIACQTIGERMSIWHKSADGCYVAHEDIQTNDVAISRCADAGTEFFSGDEL